jgi:leucine-zipper of insertion element IS481
MNQHILPNNTNKPWVQTKTNFTTYFPQLGMSKMRVIVLAITHQGLTKEQAATKYKVTKRWINILLNRYHQGGLEALEPKSRRPKTNPNTTLPEFVEAVKQMRYELETQGLDAAQATSDSKLNNQTKPGNQISPTGL